MVSVSATKLRAIRDRVGLSRNQLGQRIGMNPTTYQGYEETSKEDLPVGLVKTLIRVLVGRGTPPVTAQELWALAGVGELAEASPMAAPPSLDTLPALDPNPGDPIYDLGEAALVRAWRRMDREQRQKLLSTDLVADALRG